MMKAPSSSAVSAKSDFILYSLRRFLESPFEYYLDAKAASAFNGAVLQDQQNTVQVLFYRPQYELGPTGGPIVSLPDMLVSGYLRDDSLIRLDGFAERVQAAASRFDAMAARNESEIARQVSRIHIQTRCDLTAIELWGGCKRLAGQIAKLVDGNVTLEPEHPGDWLSPDLEPEIAKALAGHVEREAEIELRRPLREDIVAEKLQSLVPELDTSLLGDGVSYSTEYASSPGGPGSAFVHIYARHF